MDQSPFAKLSPELRNRIYELCVTFDATMIISHLDVTIANSEYDSDASSHADEYSEFEDFMVSSGPLVRPRQPYITQTCRMIRSESLSMFYATNRFTIYIPAARMRLSRWLSSTDPYRGASIKPTRAGLTRAIEWLSRTPASHHRAIGSLRIRLGCPLDTEYARGIWEKLFTDAKTAWHELAQALETHGYGNQRTEVEVWGHEPAWNLSWSREHDCRLVEHDFQKLGLAVKAVISI